MSILCHILIRNLESDADEIVTPDFCIKRLKEGDQGALARAQEALNSKEVYFGDWLLAREPAKLGRRIAEDAELLLYAF